MLVFLTARIATTNPRRVSLNVPWSYWYLSPMACRSNEKRNWFILSLICWANISCALVERTAVASQRFRFALPGALRCFFVSAYNHFALLFKWLRVNSAFTINTRWVCYSRPILLERRVTPFLITAVSIDNCFFATSCFPVRVSCYLSVYSHVCLYPFSPIIEGVRARTA